MNKLPEEFLSRAKASLKEEYPAFLSSYQRQPYKAVRVNTLKISTADFKTLSPFALSPVLWEGDGFYVSEEKAGKSVLHAAGLYYVQEPSAMCVAPMLKAMEGENILDLCSAPGGKGTQLAQAMRGEGVLFLNEIESDRAKILSRNVERLGVKNAVVINASPQQLAERFSGCFDKVLVDAPCSGEGMFLKEPEAVANWSVKNVSMCAERQKKILSSAQKLVKPGGCLAYSTCTFAEEEDERQVEEFLKTYPEFTLVEMKKLLPHKIKGEGHFAALFKKCGEGEAMPFTAIKLVPPTGRRLSAYRDFERDFLKVKFDNLHLVGDVLYSLPQNCPRLPQDLHVLRAGVCLGEFKGERFEPSHSLAMCLAFSEADFLEVDEKTAMDYLRGLTFPCGDGVFGWRLVTYRNFPLGWCKCSSGISKNRLPKGLRI